MMSDILAINRLEGEPEAQPRSALRAALLLLPLLLGSGFLVARFSGSTDTNYWYQSLALPPIQPPPAAFGIAWSLLYAMLAVAAALVWAQPKSAVRSRALWLFGIGMVINYSWSPLFFQAHLIGVALVVIAVMLMVAIWTLVDFAAVSRLAGAMLIPYIAWLVFAGLLNAWIWRINPAANVLQIGV